MKVTKKHLESCLNREILNNIKKVILSNKQFSGLIVDNHSKKFQQISTRYVFFGFENNRDLDLFIRKYLKTNSYFENLVISPSLFTKGALLFVNNNWNKKEFIDYLYNNANKDWA